MVMASAAHGTNNNSNYDYRYTYENAYDPNQVLQMAGVTVGFGKRMSWPDDYFTFQADLSYNWYYLKNWRYLFQMSNGTSNSIVLGLTLGRNSIDNPTYTRRGSTFSLNLQLTPPWSLFRKKNWQQLYEENTDESKKQLYQWIEYWKLRFKSRTYTPLTDPSGQYTLVLMTRADIGLLGYYNRWVKTPFETFYVGGDGMSGSYTYATETIALRGYDNGALTPGNRLGYAYARFEPNCISRSSCSRPPPSTVWYSSKEATLGPMWRASRRLTSSAAPEPVSVCSCRW